MYKPIPEDMYMPVTESGCWIWLGSISHTGYGNFYTWYNTAGAHRHMWNITHGDIPDNLWVLHTCDIKCCANPDHLFLGTHQDNMKDMVAKNRQSKGTDHYKYKQFIAKHRAQA